jgi:hypothetical protein
MTRRERPFYRGHVDANPSLNNRGTFCSGIGAASGMPDILQPAGWAILQFRVGSIAAERDATTGLWQNDCGQPADQREQPEQAR